MKKVIGYRIVEPAPLPVRLWTCIILVLIVFVLLLGRPAHAQDVTEPVATEQPTLVATVAPEPTAVVTPAPAPSPLNTDNAISISTLAYGIIIALLGGGTVAVVITRFGSNKPNLDALEKLYLSASPDTQEIIRERFVEIEDVVKRLLDIVDKATDGKPNDAGS